MQIGYVTSHSAGSVTDHSARNEKLGLVESLWLSLIGLIPFQRKSLKLDDFKLHNNMPPFTN